MNSNSLGNILNVIKNLKLNTVVTNTNKTLNIVKKAIPVYKEIRPYVRKEKTLFKKKEENVDIKKESINQNTELTYNDSLTFFH